MLSLHDSHTRDSIANFQSAAMNARSAFEQQQHRLKQLNSDCDSLKKQVSSLDSNIHQIKQQISQLEGEELRFRHIRSGDEELLDRHRQQLSSLRRPREQVEEEKNKMSQQCEQTMEMLVGKVTDLMTCMVQQVEDAGKAPERRRLVEEKQKEVEKWNNSLEKLKRQILSEENQLKMLMKEISVLSASSNNNNNNNFEKSKNDNNSNTSSQQQNQEEESKQFSSEISKEQLLLNSLELKLKTQIPQENSKQETEILNLRNELRKELQNLCEQVEEVDSELDECREQHYSMLDELSSTMCKKCGLRTLSIECGHDASP